MNERQQLATGHDAAADDDPLGREDADHRHEAQREVVRLERPDLFVAVEILPGPAPAGLDCATGGEPLPAVAVEGADSRERIALPIVRDPKVPELGMHQTV